MIVKTVSETDGLLYSTKGAAAPQLGGGPPVPHPAPAHQLRRGDPHPRQARHLQQGAGHLSRDKFLDDFYTLFFELVGYFDVHYPLPHWTHFRP